MLLGIIVGLVLVMVGLGAVVLLRSDGTDEVANPTTSVSSSSTTVPGATTEPGATTAAGATSSTTAKSASVPKPSTTVRQASRSSIATTGSTAGVTVSACGPGDQDFPTGLVAGDAPVAAHVASAGGTRWFDLVLDAGDEVRIDVAEIDFDPVVELLDANGTSLGLNDDGPAGFDAELFATTGLSGLHSVIVWAVDPDGCGWFDVSVTLVGTGAGGTPAVSSPPSTDSFFTTLDSVAEIVPIDLVVGDRLQIIVVDGGDGTDPFVSVNDPSGAPAAADDDSGSATEGPLDAHVDFVAGSSGTFEAFVESVNGVSGPAQVIILVN